MADQNNSIDTAQQALAPREALESQEVISFLQSGRVNEKAMAYANKLKPYTSTPEGCQALINAFYHVAEHNSHCKNNPPWNNGWYVGRMAAAAMGVTMSFLASSAHSAEKSPSNKIYKAGESLGPETQSKQIHEVLPPKQRFSIFINNRLGQVPRGRHNIIWNEQENTYFFESYPAVGRVKIMPNDQILSYQERTVTNEGEIFEPSSLLNKSFHFVKSLLGLEKLGTAEILKTAKEGDIIFHTSESSQSQAIQLATNSPITHMGLLVNHNGELQVLEAVQPVKITPLSEWHRRGETGSLSIKRLNASFDLPKVLAEAKSHLGKPYDPLFRDDDSSIYCSELVYDAFKSQGIIIGEQIPLRDLDFSSSVVQKLFLSRLNLNLKPVHKTALSNLLKKHRTLSALMESDDWKTIKDQVPSEILAFVEGPVITPASMFNSPKLVSVYDE